MQRIEVDVQSGAVKVIDLTPDEVAAALAATAAEQAALAALPPPDPVVTQSQLKAALMAVGNTPAQVQAAIAAVQATP